MRITYISRIELQTRILPASISLVSWVRKLHFGSKVVTWDFRMSTFRICNLFLVKCLRRRSFGLKSFVCRIDVMARFDIYVLTSYRWMVWSSNSYLACLRRSWGTWRHSKNQKFKSECRSQFPSKHFKCVVSWLYRHACLFHQSISRTRLLSWLVSWCLISL